MQEVDVTSFQVFLVKLRYWPRVVICLHNLQMCLQNNSTVCLFLTIPINDQTVECWIWKCHLTTKRKIFTTVHSVVQRRNAHTCPLCRSSRMYRSSELSKSTSGSLYMISSVVITRPLFATTFRTFSTIRRGTLSFLSNILMSKVPESYKQYSNTAVLYITWIHKYRMVYLHCQT